MSIVDTPDTSGRGAPINTTVPNKSSNAALSATTSSQSFAKASANSIEIINLASNSGILYIKFGY